MAVVTGATDGIGKAMAVELARKGCNVLLVSRSADKLKTCASEIAAMYPKVSVDYEAIDFSNFDNASRKRLADKVDKLEVGVLVNNVGMSYPFCQWFDELDDDEVQSLLSLNVESTTWMTRLVLPGMVRKKRGAVVNLSSAAARLPMPLLAQYSACKGYIENFTKSLSVEYAGKGISFQVQSPLFVATAMTFPGSKVPVEKRASLSTPTAKTYAKAAVAAIGYETMCSPYWAHALYVWVAERVPTFVASKGILQMHLGVRFHPKNKDKMAAKRGSGNKKE